MSITSDPIASVDPTTENEAVFTIRRGDLNAIAGRALTDEEIETIVRGLDNSDLNETVAAVVEAVI